MKYESKLSYRIYTSPAIGTGVSPKATTAQLPNKERLGYKYEVRSVEFK